MVEWLPYLEIAAPAAQEDVERATMLAQRPVPPEVVKLITEHQGQAPDKEVVDLPNGGTTPIGPILVVSPTDVDEINHTYSVSYAIDALNEWSPPTGGKQRFFPFATNTASGWFCVDQGDPAQPVVFVEMTYDPNERGGVTPLASTVAELLAKLRN